MPTQTSIHGSTSPPKIYKSATNSRHQNIISINIFHLITEKYTQCTNCYLCVSSTSELLFLLRPWTSSRSVTKISAIHRL